MARVGLRQFLRRTVVRALDVPGLHYLEQHDALYELRLLAFARQRVTPSTVAFIGSSSIRVWRTLKADFEPVPVVNRGLGGSQLEHLIRYADRLLDPTFAAIVLYGGDNDLAAGKAPEQVCRDWRTFLAQVDRRCPAVPTLLLNVKVSPTREALTETIHRHNGLLRDVARDHRCTYLDVCTPMLGPNGRPRNSFFAWDGLHLSPRGYDLWSALVWPVLEDLLAHGRPPGPRVTAVGDASSPAPGR
jgi:lysophospholipase L1-like esterase